MGLGYVWNHCETRFRRMRPSGVSSRSAGQKVGAVEFLMATGDGDLRLIDLSARLGLHKASVARLAETLGRAPLHADATSKVLVAFLREAEQLNDIRQTGFAVSAGEHIAGGSPVSVPVLDVTGRLVAAVSIHGPDSRLPESRLRECGALLVREAGPLPIAK